MDGVYTACITLTSSRVTFAQSLSAQTKTQAF